jgi:hypothetical protein
MQRRASRTAYYLNRGAGYLALVANGVRFPASVGVWFPVAEAEQTSWDVVELLAVVYPGEVNERLPFVALLTDHDVDEFQRELRRRGLLSADDDAPVPDDS